MEQLKQKYPYVDEKTISDLGGEKISNLNEGLKILDIISLCVPLNKDTKNMIIIIHCFLI